MAHVNFSEQQLDFGTEGSVLLKVGDLEFVAFPGLETEHLQLVEKKKQKKVPLTVVPVHPGASWGLTSFQRHIQRIENEDDVSQPAFRQIFIFWATTIGKISLGGDLLEHLRHCQTEFLVVNPAPKQGRQQKQPESQVKGGPYLLVDGQLWPIYRLYADHQRAFLRSLCPPRDEFSYQAFRLGGDDPLTLDVPVPARQVESSGTCPVNPIHGKRVLVKDCFEIKGLQTTVGSRAYFELASRAEITAAAIQVLIDRGAALVGQAKLSALISREEPSECVDYDAAFNPRGDGIQSPAGSSSGSAAAIAAYDWLDYAIGTDSTGSTRRPAFVNGCFSIRLSTTALPKEGMVSYFPLFDAVSLFSRDIRGMSEFVRHWCSSLPANSRNNITSVVVPTDYLRLRDSRQQQIFGDFVKDLGKYCRSNIRYVSLQQTWRESCPSSERKQPLHDYLINVGCHSFIHDFYHSFSGFRDKYTARFDADPPVNEVTRKRWEAGARVSRQQRDEAVRKLKVYKDWLLRRILPNDGAVMVLPIGDVMPNYRDRPAYESPAIPDAWDQLWLSPILGAPEVTLPIDQVQYMSRETNREEMLPVAASILGRSHTDVSLLKLAENVLRYARRPLRVASGRQIFVDDWEMVERTSWLSIAG